MLSSRETGSSPHLVLLIACALLLLIATPDVCAAEKTDLPQLTPAEVAAGWQLLFDGKSFDGWRGYKKDGMPAKGWVVEDGCMKVQAGVGGGDIMTVGQYSEFDFVFEWKASPGANSGVMFHVTEIEKQPWRTGPEYQIFDDAAHNVDPASLHGAGALYALYPPENKNLKPAGEFNQGRIVVKDGRLTHFLNGRKLLEAKIGSDDWKERIAKSKFNAYSGFGNQGKGHIDLQDHGHDVWFRNLKIRDLTEKMPGEVELFNGKDFSGWSAFTEDGGTSFDAWLVEDGLLKTRGQPIGYIYTDATYESYVLKLEWRFNPETKKAGNSGVLLRLGGVHKVWPQSVEAQLHSTNAGDFWNIGEYDMKVDKERTRGRNTKKTHFAEHPVGEWNEYEIVVDGTDITLIVNGEVVNNAWDVAVRAGHIALQSEGSELHFRRIRLAPID